MERTSLNNYTTPVEENEIFKSTTLAQFNSWFINQIKVFLNCTRVMKCGQRAIQTNDPRYKNELSITIASIKENIDDDKQEKYLNILKLRHELNLKYENKHGFDYEIKKKKQTKDKVKKAVKRKEPKQMAIPINVDLKKLNFILN